MRSCNFLFPSILSLACCFSATTLQAQETPATIPASFFGTYELTYGDFSNGAASSYFDDGDQVIFVLKSGNVLCAGGEEFTNPVFRNGNTVEAFWADGLGLEVGVSNISSGNFNEINAFIDGSFAGQLSGSKTSNATDCSVTDTEGGISVSGGAQSILDLVDELFSQVFGSGADLQEVQGYIYRFYPAAGAYIGFKDGSVFTYGGPFGNQLKNFGAITAVTTSLENYKAKIEIDLGEIDTGGVDITGNYNLTISGTIATVAGGIALPAVPFDLTVNDIVAPDPNDLDAVNEALSTSIEGISGLAELEVVVTNSTSERITFTVAFSATQNGVSVEYELEYDYVKV